jgi:hypothetical protein
MLKINQPRINRNLCIQLPLWSDAKVVVLRYTMRFTHRPKAPPKAVRPLALNFDIVSAYARILESVRKGNVAYAVFVVSGRARMAAINSSLFQEASKAMPERMIGIYDQSVNPEWLMQDLQNAESEARHEYSQSL